MNRDGVDVLFVQLLWTSHDSVIYFKIQEKKKIKDGADLNG